MDTTLLIEIIVAAFVIFLFIKFVVSPVIKVILGVIIFLFLIYLLQRFFGIGLDKILAPFGISLNLDRWSSAINWIFSPLDGYIQQLKNLANFVWRNFADTMRR